MAVDNKENNSNEASIITYEEYSKKPSIYQTAIGSKITEIPTLEATNKLVNELFIRVLNEPLKSSTFLLLNDLTKIKHHLRNSFPFIYNGIEVTFEKIVREKLKDNYGFWGQLRNISLEEIMINPNDNSSCGFPKNYLRFFNDERIVLSKSILMQSNMIKGGRSIGEKSFNAVIGLKMIKKGNNEDCYIDYAGTLIILKNDITTNSLQSVLLHSILNANILELNKLQYTRISHPGSGKKRK